MKFTLIHASYGRPMLAFETFRNWLHSSAMPFQYIISIDKSDSHLETYKAIFEEEREKHENIGIMYNVTNTSVAAINNAAKHCSGEIIIVISDDFEPIENWDLEILKIVEGKSDWILKTQDGTQPWIITLPILDRSYYERMGYIYHPAYTHMFCDTELTHLADLTGRKLKCDLLFKHNHYSVGGIQKDATSEKADRTWNHGEALYLKHVREWQAEPDYNVFNLPAEAQGHINWLKQKLK